MAAVTAQSIVASGTTPSPIAASASDTIAAGQFGPTGCIMRVITTTTATDVTVQDPGTTTLGNPGAETPVSVPSGEVRMILVPRAAVDPATAVATIAFSATTGVTYELYRV